MSIPHCFPRATLLLIFHSDPLIGKKGIVEDSIDPRTGAPDRRDSVLTTNDLKTEHTASSLVFDTYELLEQILLQLDNATILRLLRINKTWNHVINRSHALQVKLFFKVKVPHGNCPNTTFRWNPYLLARCVRNGDCQYHHCQAATGQDVILVQHESQKYARACLKTPSNLTKGGLDASWRRMLLCQGVQPTSKLAVQYRRWDPSLTILTNAEQSIGQVWKKMLFEGKRGRFYLWN